MIEERSIYDQLERLAQKYPWDTVAIWVRRQPSGLLEYTAYIEQNETLGFDSVFGHGKSAEEAADDIIKNAGNRDPEKQRKAKIAELRLKIIQLESVNFLLPPYRAPGQIGYGEAQKAQPTTPRVIDINSREDEVPF